MKRILLWQLIFVLFLATISAIFWQPVTTLAICAGGFLVIIPNLLFGAMLSRWVDPRSPKKTVFALFIGEALKVVMMAALLISMLHFYTVPLAPLLLGFFGAYITYFIFGYRVR